MRKTLFAALALVMIAALPALGQEEAEQTVSIPKPPGATVTMEMDISREQILQQIDSTAAMISESAGKGGMPKIDLSKIKEAFDTVEHVQVAEMSIKGKYSPTNIIADFEKQVGGRRIIYDTSMEPGWGLLLLAVPEDGGYFFAAIEAKKDNKGKTTGATINAAQIFGFPDVAKLAEFAGQLVRTFSKELFPHGM